MPVTLKDISARVGKSVPTVSRALAGHADISPDTRREVQRVAREMGYEPNIAARNLQKQRTDTIALIFPMMNQLRFSDPFFSEFLSGIVEQTAVYGYTLNISTNAAVDERDAYLKQIRSRRVDGFVVMRTKRQDERINLLREQNIPFVSFGRVEGDNDFHFVDDDDADGIRQCVDHLVSLGHTRLGFISEPANFTKSFHRLQGFTEGLEAHNLALNPEMVVETNFRQRSGRIAAEQLFNLNEPPTAIVASNDLLALGAMHEAQSRGLVVGRDVSITGFDDILLAEYANPPLTTVHQPAQQLGSMVAQMLLKIIRKESIEKTQVILKPSLIVRQSSGTLQQKKR
ncbi:MAG: LacI family transcriptional regulator [Chloroflexi bacterium]|nr:MAG: LacI family transcriptional regulator [Chloroflexota bacterium]